MVDARYIVVFDGVCNFCIGAVNFIIKRDPDGLFVFTPIQSDVAQKLMVTHGIHTMNIDTLLLIKSGHCFMFSSAALEIARDLTGGWFLLNVFRVLPTPIRDFAYKLFARNRYRLFGRRPVCMVPTMDIKERFIGI